ncbi:hypothetical protein [Streptomyces umbrinus]|uniref:hypothetical protein n=1 Tax=Streptomyces umbrinus TaxID=67370 RepID=UPI003C2FECD2
MTRKAQGNAERTLSAAAQYAQALEAAAQVVEASAQLEHAWSTRPGVSNTGHAHPVQLEDLDQLVDALGYQVVRSRPNVPTDNGSWFQDEPTALNRTRTRSLIDNGVRVLGARLLRDPNDRLYVVNHRVHIELIPVNVEPPHTEGDVLRAALGRYGLATYEDGESGVSWLTVPIDPATPEREIYERPHFRISSGEHAERVASAHDDPWGASFYDADGEYIDSLDASPSGSTLAEDSAHCARAVTQYIAGRTGTGLTASPTEPGGQ